LLDIAWTPSPEVIAAANSTRFARQHGLAGYEELLARSVADPAWFWGAMVDHLGLVFDHPHDAVLDESAGIEWTRWFVGGRLNLAFSCIDRHVEAGRGEQVAVRAESEDGAVQTLTYAELLRESARVAEGLAAHGIESGDRVALLMPFTADAVVAWYAVVRLGAVVVPIFSGFAAPAIAARLTDSGARAVVTAAAAVRRGRRLPIREAVVDALRSSPSVELLVVHGGRSDGGPAACVEVSWDDLVAGQPGTRPCASVDAEHPLMVCYTSGTSGRPKGAVHVHAGFLVKTATEVHFQADVQEGDVLFWLSDMGWIMAPWIIVGAHALGQTVVLYHGAPDQPGPDRLWSLVARHRITFLGLAPTLVRALQPHGAGLARRYDLSSLRLFGSAGEPWNPEPYRWLSEEVGDGRRPVINLSGGTEVGSSFLSCDVSLPIRACSLGRPALGMAVDVYGPDGEPLRGGVGELVCTRPWPAMTRGLWGDADRYLATYWRRWPGVWVHGDWASVEVDGAWYLHGRSDDTLNVAGKRIGSADYESALVGHPAVLEACAVGMPHPVKGEAPWCFVCLVDPGGATPALRSELAGRLEEQLGKAFRAERIAFTTALPRTRSAKIVRRAVRAVALGEDPGDVSTLEDPAALDAIRVAVQRSS
jgi:acetyl-CoA synthetase